MVTFEVRIEITDDNKSLLKPEMTANVEIIVAEKDNALTLPIEAVGRKKGQSVVTVLKPDGTTEERVVEVGINNGTLIEIVSGLSDNDTVVVKTGEMASQFNREGGPPGPPGGAGNPMRLMGGRPR